jgi:GT2 family glycosyltransferase
LSDSWQKAWPKVTVVIVNWNGARFLERCLTALLAQTVTPYEIILVDNASTDGSLEITRRFPLVRLLAQNSNTGFARGNNLAINAAAAGSELIALLNPDAFPEPRWLEECLLSAQRNPQFDIFGGKLLNAADPTVLDGAGDAYHMSGLVWRMGHGIPASALHESEREVFSPCAAAALQPHPTHPPCVCKRWFRGGAEGGFQTNRPRPAMNAHCTPPTRSQSRDIPLASI